MTFSTWVADFFFGIKPKANSEFEPASIERERSLALTAFYNSWILMVAALSFGVSQIIDDSKFAIEESIADEITVAFMVAYIIILTIEYRSRKELNIFMEDFTRKSHENFFQVVLGVQFPIKMFELVRNYIMQERVYRQNMEVHFTLRRGNNSRERFSLDVIDVEMFCSFDLSNLSDRPYDYTHRLFFEETESSKFPEMAIDGKLLTKEELKAADDAGAVRPGLRTYEFHIYLDRHGSKRIAIRTFFSRLIADTMIWQSTHACDGLKLSVTHPAELAVKLHPLHPEPLQNVEKNDVRQMAEISCPLFPGNGISFWWVPIEPPNSNLVSVESGLRRSESDSPL